MNNAARFLAVLSAAITLIFVPKAQAGVRMVASSLPVAFSEALADARSIAGLHADASILQVSGSSMHPFFGNGALLVVKPIALGQLRKGMVVVYTNRFGETVAHRLVSVQAGGWVAQGYNNSQPDSTLITSSNLRGVVYATINSSAGQTLASGVGMPAIALAAPAR